MLITYLSTRKTTIPFTSIKDLYLHTNFKVVVIPNTADEGIFKHATDPIFQNIYEERIKPYLLKYLDYPILSVFDCMSFINNDFKIAAFISYRAAM